ncbi:MAG: hypothetical protein V8T40_14085 [Phocaeicola vulgatus]
MLLVICYRSYRIGNIFDENEKDLTLIQLLLTVSLLGMANLQVQYIRMMLNFNITYTHDWGVVTKTFKVTVTRKVQ